MSESSAVTVLSVAIAAQNAWPGGTSTFDADGRTFLLTLPA
jgi:hypothetical protein